MSSRPRIAVDTNLLVYAEGILPRGGNDARVAAAERLLTTLDPATTVMPAQVAGELFGVMVRVGGWSKSEAAAKVRRWSNVFEVRSTAISTLDLAWDIATRHQFGHWDAIVLATAVEAGCEALLSEDMQDGFVFRGVEVIDPFKTDVPRRFAIAGLQ